LKPLLPFLFLFISALFQYGCKSLPDKPPVPQDKMTRVLLDMQLAESYSMGLGDSVKNKFEKNYDSLAIFYQSILKHHKLTLEEFTTAMDWYEAHPVMIDSVFNNVINLLSETKAKEGISDIVPTPETGPGRDTLHRKTKDSLSHAAPPAKDTAAKRKDLPVEREP